MAELDTHARRRSMITLKPACVRGAGAGQGLEAGGGGNVGKDEGLQS
jgi:hypothetical protein